MGTVPTVEFLLQLFLLPVPAVGCFLTLLPPVPLTGYLRDTALLNTAGLLSLGSSVSTALGVSVVECTTCNIRYNGTITCNLKMQVAVRSILLRGFDQQVAEKLGDVMKDLGVKFVRPAVPSKIEKVRAPQFAVQDPRSTLRMLLSRDMSQILG